MMYVYATINNDLRSKHFSKICHNFNVEYISIPSNKTIEFHYFHFFKPLINHIVCKCRPQTITSLFQQTSSSVAGT